MTLTPTLSREREREPSEREAGEGRPHAAGLRVSHKWRVYHFS